jgi:hypothetical protein
MVPRREFWVIRMSVVLPRRPARFRPPPHAWRRAASLLAGAILFAATLTAGTRFAYCAAMGPFAGAHCACLTAASRTAQAPALERSDCHRVVVVGALPAGSLESRGASVPSAPRQEIATAPVQGDAIGTELMSLRDPHPSRQRAGPARPASAARSRLMVFLL